MKRPSGGRGEYEVAEAFGLIGPRDLLDREVRIQVGRVGARPTGVTVRERQGKLRLRIEAQGAVHAHRQIAASSLLPKPTRSEASLLGGHPVVLLNRYELRIIHFDNVTIGPATAHVLLGDMEAGNGPGTVQHLDFSERVQRIERLQDEAGRLPQPIADALNHHRALLEGGEPLTTDAEEDVDLLMALAQAHGPAHGVEYAYGTDVLPALEGIAELAPLAPLPPAPLPAAAPVPPGPVGEAYRPANEEAAVAEIDPFTVDPAIRERGLRGHAATQNALAAWVTGREMDPRSPRTGEPNFDVAWQDGDRLFVAEVKSMTFSNEEKQLRLGLGQVLRYRHVLRRHGLEVVGVLAAEKRPEDHSWEELCAGLDVLLVWPENMAEVLDAARTPT